MSPVERLTALEDWRQLLRDERERERVAQADTNKDHETRLRRIERNMYIGMGLVMALDVILKFAH